MGFWSKLTGSGEPVHPAKVKEFGRTGRGSAKVAAAYAQQHGSGRSKSLAQQRKEHLAAQRQSGRRTSGNGWPS